MPAGNVGPAPGAGLVRYQDLTDNQKAALDRFRAQQKGKNEPSPPAGADPTVPEMINQAIDEWEPTLLKILGVGAILGVAYLGWREVTGRPTILRQFLMSQTGTEIARGTFDVMGNVAKASVSSPGLRLLSAFVLTETMKRLKLTSEGPAKWIMIGVTSLEGVEVAGDLISGFTSFLGSKKSEGPQTLAFTDARSFNVPLEGLPVMDQPAQLQMNPLVRKAIEAISSKDKKALMQ